MTNDLDTHNDADWTIKHSQHKQKPIQYMKSVLKNKRGKKQTSQSKVKE